MDLIPGRAYTIGVCLLTALIAFPAQWWILAPELGGFSSWHAYEVLVPLNVLVAMVYINYYFVSTTDPGRVPIDWEPPHWIASSSYGLEGVAKLRYCKSCDRLKPPRAHHCRQCRRCVLKMDHHCPWVNNCVGYFNYAHFLRFLLSVILACTYIVVLLLWYMRDVFDLASSPTITQLVVFSIDFVLAFIVMFSVSILGGYHVYCLALNQTTIEAWEKSKSKQLVLKGRIAPVEFPFYLGIYRNICSVLGDRPWLWMWPQRATGDGVTFAVRDGSDPRMPYFWPPHDPGETAHRLPGQEFDHVDSEDDDELNGLVSNNRDDGFNDEEQGIRRLPYQQKRDTSSQPVFYRKDANLVPEPSVSRIIASSPSRQPFIQKTE